ncbi:hypothetical protein P872_14380 [Rhodonellum psychrophilum GCM71 = DSM 17998]|uniref:Gas vesicle protein n=2 Tax=Rhodonellum TaxID=336827 RepID=U5BU90_9BACT|nr:MULTISPECIES: YtxH domain-containing protein [Rhodonellum]ERM80156.1 hypothetical protein P872_14380 [Rhodonellum psychrophilum GCM71 = DSM 17998]SDY84246.1 hypothetical protein SAMN05444412_103109 [Rhodonellum ikkaensis]
MKYSNNNGKSLGTIITLGLLGAAVGVMLIPYKKNKIRERVIVGAQDLANFVSDILKEKADDLLSTTESVIEKSKTNFNQFTHEVNDKLEQGKYK